ncbi:helix-turn-helix domain-containing protein [Cohnella phaseoli]|uniref:Helix-turn-helix protein n=1 Tax=Cohnella phaseoli TaxID=456490 RepID=A0A3D9I8U9_9BACL|nr:helix-turn-helix domain-containing protein [Cohnella phaseoli]RED58204.1 helix-turn-helix protein [Cohnella phaseoli]
MKTNWFNRLLLSYLPVFFIISLSLLLMTYLTLSEMSKKASVKASQALSQNIVKLIDNRLEAIDSLLFYEIQNNDRLKQFFSDNSREHRKYTDIQAVSTLKELLQNNPVIDSIYLYRAPDQTVLTTSTLTLLDQFPDKQYIGLIFNSRAAYSWTARTLPSTNGENEATRVVSLAKNTNLQNLSFLIVNVRIDALGEWIASMADKRTTFVRLNDADHRPIVSLDDEEGSASSDVNPGKVLSTAVSEKTGWIVSSGNRNGGMLEFVSSLFYLWMAIASLIVIAGFAWIIYVSRRHYKPIQTLISLISGKRAAPLPAAAAEQADEFKLIESTIEDLFDESNALQEQHKEMSVYHKRHLFLSLIENANATANFGRYIEEEMTRLGIEKPVSSSLVAIVEIDHYAEFTAQYGRDQHLLKYILGASVKELVENKPFTVWTEWISSSKMGILFLFHGDEGEPEVRDICEKLREWVEGNLDFTITIGVGQLSRELEMTGESFREAVNAVGYKSSLGMNRIIAQEHMASKPKGELFMQLQYFRMIGQSFRLGDEKWEEYYEEMFVTLQKQLYTRDDLHSLMQVLIGYLQKEMAELPEELNDLWMRDIQPSLSRAIEEETQEEVYSAFREILRQAFERIGKLRESKSSHQLVHQIKSYIEENYGNPELSLTHLSDAFGLNPKYLSRLFREAFGSKFIEFVTEIRMENAARLLKETPHTIQDIGRAVGYDQSLTFIRVFKKQFGETPGQYRKKSSE